MPLPCGTANALDCHPRTSNSRTSIGPHRYQDTTLWQCSTGSINRVATVLGPRLTPGNRRALATFYSAPSRRIAPAPAGAKHWPKDTIRPPALASRPLTWKAKVGYVVETTEWTSGRVLEAPATGIGERPTTGPARRSEAVPDHRWNFPGSPAVHDTWRSKYQVAEGRFTLADLVRWMVLPRPVTQASWRPAPLPAGPCRPMATPPIRILALSPAQAFRAACRAGQRLPVPPTGRANSLPSRPILSPIRLP